MLTQKELEDCAEYLAGSCQIGGSYMTATGTDLTLEEEEQLEAYLASIELFECESCGWWGFPGEPLNENGHCSECAEENN